MLPKGLYTLKMKHSSGEYKAKNEACENRIVDPENRT